MFALGMLAILHVLLLPGLLIVRALGLHRDGLLRGVLLAAPLSLVANHLMVFALTAAGVYTRGVLAGVIALELLAALVLWWRDRGRAPALGADIERWRALVPALAARRPWPALASILLLVAGLWMAGLWVLRAWEVLGTVFRDWDAVVSWNRWAIDWANNRLPELTWHYPQLLPTAYASTYVLIGGTEVTFFAKAIAAAFPLLMLGALLDLCLRTGRAAYAAAAWGTGWLLWMVLGTTTMCGYADGPVAAMSFVSVYALLAGARSVGWREARGLVLAGAVIAGGAALTKQAGWLIAGVYTPLAALLVIGPRAGPPLRAKWAGAGLALLAIVATAGPWYIYRRLSPSGHEFEYLLGTIHGDRTYAQRAARGLSALVEGSRIPAWVVWYAAPVGLAGSLLDRQWRWITLLFTAPMIGVWLLYFTYDQRNLATALAPAAAGAAVGAAALLGLLGRGAGLLERRGGGRASAAGAALGVAAAAACVWLSVGKFRESVLLRRQRAQQMEIGVPALNRLLADYHRASGFGGKVLSNYQIMAYLPEVGSLYVFDPMGEERLSRRLLAGSGASHVLYSGPLPEPEYLARWAREGVLEEVRRAQWPHLPGAVLWRITGAAP